MTKQYTKVIYSQTELGMNTSIAIRLGKSIDDYSITSRFRSTGHRKFDHGHRPYRIAKRDRFSSDYGICSVLIWRRAFMIKRFVDSRGKVV